MTLATIARSECANVRHHRCLFSGVCGVTRGAKCGVRIGSEHRASQDYFESCVLHAHAGKPEWPALSKEYQERKHG